jgi:hypothetical protein
MYNIYIYIYIHVVYIIYIYIYRNNRLIRKLPKAITSHNSFQSPKVRPKKQKMLPAEVTTETEEFSEQDNSSNGNDKPISR